jgi:hypothetical protein
MTDKKARAKATAKSRFPSGMTEREARAKATAGLQSALSFELRAKKQIPLYPSQQTGWGPASGIDLREVGEAVVIYRNRLRLAIRFCG